MENKKNLRGLIIFLVVLLLVMGGTYFFSHTYLTVFPIKGMSMAPTLKEDDNVVLFKTKKVKYDDVIIFFYEPMNKYLIKRVIGVAGDRIEIKYSYDDSLYHVYRNGEFVDETNINDPMQFNFNEMDVIVPEGKLFVLGDNRLYSSDSHNGVYADVSEIQGKAFLRYTGWKDIEFIK